ncbi:MAG: NAD(+) diphosphatase [Lachnospiraceae bacterium]|nr:NAD(+) diphosphatase [Lachnospiraceae bacterium]
MIQDIAPHVLRNEYMKDEKPGAESEVYVFDGRRLLAGGEGEKIHLPLYGDFPEGTEAVFLFRFDGKARFLLGREEELPIPEGYAFAELKALRASGKTPREFVFAAWTALQLARWYGDNRYCGSCGMRTIFGTIERSLICPHCGRVIYPRIIPAVIVGVTNGDEIVLTRYAGRDIPYYALVAGFTEIGESLEGTVRREVMEEVGLKVKNIRYYKSQPWAIVDDLLAGFYCDLDGDSTIRRDDGELKEASWVRREDVVLQPDDYSLTNEMMRMFKEGKEPR